MVIEKNEVDHAFYQMPVTEPFQPKDAPKEKLFLFGRDISSWRKSCQFLLCVGGVFFFYLLYGYYQLNLNVNTELNDSHETDNDKQKLFYSCHNDRQELIFRIPGFKPFGWYLTLVQFGLYFLFASFESYVILGDTQRRITMSTYALLAFLTVGTMGMSNASLGYLNYPTAVIFKCCKLIPVLIGGILIQGKLYELIDWLACIFMSIGLTFFILADSTIQPKFNYIGVLMMSAALCADAAIGNVQEKAMKSTQATNTEVVQYSYGIGFLYIFIVLCLSGMLKDGFLFYWQDPVQIYGYTFIFSITGYLGISFVLTLIKAFGALPAVTVTTCRKAVTIVLSFLLFAKPFTIQYIWSGAIVLFGIVLNIYRKNKNEIDKQIFTLTQQLFQQQNLKNSSKFYYV